MKSASLVMMLTVYIATIAGDLWLNRGVSQEIANLEEHFETIVPLLVATAKTAEARAFKGYEEILLSDEHESESYELVVRLKSKPILAVRPFEKWAEETGVSTSEIDKAIRAFAQWGELTEEEKDRVLNSLRPYCEAEARRLVNQIRAQLDENEVDSEQPSR